MKRFAYALLACLFLALPCDAAAVIVLDDRVPNRADVTQDEAGNKSYHGYCAWACIETLGRHNRVDKLRGLVEWRQKSWPVQVTLRDVDGRFHTIRRNYGSDLAVQRCLEYLEVSFRQQATGTTDTLIVRRAVLDGSGVAVGMLPGAFEGMAADEGHAVIVLNFSRDFVTILDPNRVGVDKTFTRKWFDTYWMGWAVTIRPAK